MPALADLLSWADNKRRVVGRNLSDLVNNPADYLSMTAANIPQTVKEYGEDPMNFVGGGVGHIAYHGSPHKFDKFSLDKIGTGEGAQAYGHGLYLAESPVVATEYKEAISNAKAPELYRARSTAKGAQTDIDQITGWLNGSTPWPNNTRGQPVSKEFLEKRLKEYQDDVKWSNDLMASREENGILYKTDIPDEAVARFLDWDKPLSQHAPEVQAALSKLGVKTGETAEEIQKRMINYGMSPSESAVYAARNAYTNTGELAYAELGRNAVASEKLRQAGIPGIRYLDGGSRSAGAGSSNFVAFDPELIRILERNGQPTGQVPWKPNEWRPLSDLTNPRID